MVAEFTTLVAKTKRKLRFTEIFTWKIVCELKQIVLEVYGLWQQTPTSVAWGFSKHILITAEELRLQSSEWVQSSSMSCFLCVHRACLMYPIQVCVLLNQILKWHKVISPETMAHWKITEAVLSDNMVHWIWRFPGMLRFDYLKSIHKRFYAQSYGQ